MTHVRTKVLDDLPPALRHSAAIFDARRLLRTAFSLKPLPATPERISVEALDDDGLAIANPTSKMMRVVGNSWRAVHAGVIGNTSTDPSGDGRWNNAHQITGVVTVGGWVYCVVSYAEGLSSAIYKWKVGFPNKRYRVRLKDSLTATFIATDGQYVFVNGVHSVYDRGANTNTYHSITIAIEPQADGSDRDVQLPGSEPLAFDNNSQTYYALTRVSSAGIPSPNGVWNQRECTSGFAVNAQFYIVARELDGKVVVYDRSNVPVQTWLFDRPRHVVLSGMKVWVSSGDNTLDCYTLNGDGSLGAKVGGIAGLVDPVGVSISPSGQRLVTIDGNRYNRPGSTATHKMRVWSTATGDLLRTVGSGDYAVNVLVNDRKFFFINGKSFAKTTRGAAVPFVQFLNDDDICIGDTCNFRNLFYRLSTDTMFDRLYHVGYFYSCRLVSNREEWLLMNYCRYRIDWQAVVRDQSVVNNWTLEANYGAFQRPEFDDEYNRGLDITMWPNGRVFAFQQHQDLKDGSAPDYYLQLVEFSDSGITYFDGEHYPIGTNLNRDLSLVRDRAYIVNEQGELVLDGNNRPIERSVGDTDANGIPNTNLLRERQAWTTNYKASGVPAWASPVTKKVLNRITKRDPITFGGGPGRNTYTTSGIWGFYCLNGTYNPDRQPFGDVERRRGYYFGGSPIDFTDTTGTAEAGLNFRTLKPTLRGIYDGNFPVDRMEDSNGSWNMAAYAYAAGNHFFTVALGEHWKDRQVHVVNIRDDFGQQEFQYGAANRSDDQLEEAAPFLASNGKTGDFYLIPDTDACGEVINDEGMQGGVLTCLILNMSSSWVRTYPLEAFTPQPSGNLDLHAGLPASGPIANGTGRLRRSAPESESFSVRAGVLEPEAAFEDDLADVHITLKPQLSPNLHAVEVYLDFTDAVPGLHEIEVIARYLLQAFDDGGDHCYLETIDRNGRIINQLNRTRNSSTGNGELRHNGKLLGTRTVEQWRPLSYNRSLLKTGVDATGTYVDYADFGRSYATGPLDPAANPQDATALRVRIDSPSSGNREFGVNLAGAKYTSLATATTSTTPPTPIMLSFTPTKKLTIVRRTGPSMAISLANASWLDKVLKFTGLTPPNSAGSNSRSAYTGAFGSLKPGGTLATFEQGENYEVNLAVFDGSWSMPDFVEVTTPQISSLNPVSVAPGDVLNITGKNLLYTNYVLIGGVPALIDKASVTSTNVAVTVPLTAAGSNVAVVLFTETGNTVNLTLTVTSSPGGASTTLTAQSSDFRYNQRNDTVSAGAGYVWRDAIAAWSLSFGGGSLVVRGRTNYDAQYLSAARLDVFVNKTFFQTLIFTQAGVEQSFNLANVPAGVVDIFEGPAYRGQELGDVRVSNVTSVTAPAGTAISVVPLAKRSTVVIVLGNSRTMGANGANPGVYGYVPQLAKQLDADYYLLGYSSLQLMAHLGTAAGRAQIRDEVAARSVGYATVYVVIGDDAENDWYYNTTNPAMLAQCCASTLDLIHTALPDAKLFSQTLLQDRDNPDNANAGGFKPSDYNAALVAVFSNVSYVKLIDASQFGLVASDYANPQHLNDSGDTKKANFYFSIFVYGVPPAAHLDDFSTPNRSAIWTPGFQGYANANCVITQPNGQFAMQATSGAGRQNGYTASAARSMTGGKLWYGKITQVFNAVDEAIFLFYLGQFGSNVPGGVGFLLQNRTLQFSTKASTGGSVPYDPAAHLYWGIRELNGTLLYQLSADAVTWKTVYTNTNIGFDINSAALILAGGGSTAVSLPDGTDIGTTLVDFVDFR